MDEDFEVSFPYLTASQLFFEDPLENLRLHVLVKRVPPQVRRLGAESAKRAALAQTHYDSTVAENARVQRERRAAASAKRLSDPSPDPAKQNLLSDLNEDEDIDGNPSSDEQPDDLLSPSSAVQRDTVARAEFAWQSKEFSSRELLTYSHQRFRTATPLQQQHREKVAACVKAFLAQPPPAVVEPAANVQRKFTFEGTENSSAQSNAIMSPVSQHKAAISASALMNMDVQSEPLTAAALEEGARSLVRARGIMQLCTRIDEDAYVAPSELCKRSTTSEVEEPGMFSSRNDGVHMNDVARALVTLPAHKGNAASAVTKSMKVKSFYILLARAPDREDDMLSLSSIKHVGKEIVLVQAFAQPNGTLSIKPDLCSESAMGVWGLGHRFRMRTRVASNNAFLSALRTGSTWVEEEFEFWVSNAAAPPANRTATAFELESERRRLIREADLATNRAITTFEAPPQMPFLNGTGIGGASLNGPVMRVIVNGEIVRAKGFGENALFVQYELWLPPDWHCQQSSAGPVLSNSPVAHQAWSLVSCTHVSHACLEQDASGEEKRVSNFSFPLEFDLLASLQPHVHRQPDSVSASSTMSPTASRRRSLRQRSSIQLSCQGSAQSALQTEGDESDDGEDGDVTGPHHHGQRAADDDSASRMLLEWPRVYMQVISVDGWGRHSAAGYGYFSLPDRPGTHEISVTTWRPMGSIRSERDRFFIGSTPFMQDIKLSGIPLDWRNSFFNRYGFDTTSDGGAIDIRMHCMHVRQPAPKIAAMMSRQKSSVVSSADAFGRIKSAAPM